MRIAYFDCFSGVAGDMILGALVDAGVPLTVLKEAVAALGLPGLEVEARKVMRGGFATTKVDVLTGEPSREADPGLVDAGHPPHHSHRRLPDILEVLRASRLPEATRERAAAIFTRLAAAEAAVHGSAPEAVHFHEVGARDAIADVVGAVAGLAALGADRVEASPLNLGGGRIATAHGTLPVPAPGTLELLKGIPCYGSPVEAELTTPTGAAILATVAAAFGPPPLLTVRAVGYGAGTRELTGQPNCLRLILGDSPDPGATDEVAVLEANIDDMSPQLFEPLMEDLFAAGALDVYLTPVIMKKSRPATVLTVLAEAGAEGRLAPLILQGSTTFGLRLSRRGRLRLAREIRTVETPYGAVAVKVGRLGERTVQVSPEFEECRRVAAAAGVPVRAVLEAAREAARRQITGGE
ncbi:MAG: nickel pincer cofactor biosynthesis protein LarC [Candidatus Methylomirabilales bacterium]